MEQWNDFKYGPLRIEDVQARQIRCDQNNIHTLNRVEFIVLIRLMTCYGRAVSRDILLAGLTSDCALRVAVCRLRKFLKSNFRNVVSIERRSRFGYSLSLLSR